MVQSQTYDVAMSRRGHAVCAMTGLGVVALILSRNELAWPRRVRHPRLRLLSRTSTSQ